MISRRINLKNGNKSAKKRKLDGKTAPTSQSTEELDLPESNSLTASTTQSLTDVVITVDSSQLLETSDLSGVVDSVNFIAISSDPNRFEVNDFAQELTAELDDNQTRLQNLIDSPLSSPFK